jgi:hypothetical protein
MTMRLGLAVYVLTGCATVVVEPNAEESGGADAREEIATASNGGGGSETTGTASTAGTGAGGSNACPGDWTHILGGTGANWLRGQAVGPDGSVAVTVDSTADITLDGASLGFDQGGLVVVKFGPTGEFAWARRFGESNQLPRMPVEFDLAGNVLVGGIGYGTITLGNLVANHEGSLGYVVKYSPEGEPLWLQSWSVPIESGGLSNLALDAAGNTYFQGSMGYDAESFQWGSLSADGETFIGKILADGTPAWVRGFDGVLVEADGLATTPEGHVVIGQSLVWSGTFGDVELSAVDDHDALMFELDADGAVVDARQFGDAELQRSYGFVIGPTGSRALLGVTWGAVDFGGGAVSSPGANDVFLAGFDANGENTWTKTAPNRYGSNVIAATADGGVALVVTREVAAAFDCGASEAGFVLAQLDSSGVCHASEPIAHCTDASYCSIFLGGVAVSSERNVVSGYFSGSAVLRGELHAADIWDGFVSSQGSCASR